MSKKFVFEGVCEFDKEDSGAALISQFSLDPAGKNEDSGLFVRVQSWDETREHKDASTLAGKRLRVTVEVIEEVKWDDDLPKIPAECHSDDGAVEVNFNAVRWVKQASDDDLLNLLKIGCGGDVYSDFVAEYMADYNDEVGAMFSYLEIINRKPGAREIFGFECHVGVDALMDWLQVNKPDIFTKVMNDEDIMEALKTGYHLKKEED